jgi:hypothetical protein
MKRFKFKTVENPLATVTIGWMSAPEAPTSVQLFEQLMDTILAGDDDPVAEGVADSLMRAYVLQADAEREDEEREALECLAGNEAETLMRQAYVEGLVIGHGKEWRKRIQEDVDSGNSGWWWPEALKWGSEVEIYPRTVCEQYGLMLGYKHAVQSKQMQKFAERVDEVGFDQAQAELRA